MRTVVVGAGPAGLFSAIALARRGREVVVVDRDPGPPEHGQWRRRGLMQFAHAHSFRRQVIDALDAEMPDVMDALLASGATTATDGLGRAIALHCRRSVFERELWRCAARQPRLQRVTGHVDSVAIEDGRAVGVRVGHRLLDAGVVLDASGRASRFLRALRGRGEGSDCGATYVGRLYQLRPGAPAGPTNSAIGLSLGFADYAGVVFLHDNRTFTVTLIHSGTDQRLHRLRDADAFERAVRAIPLLADWVDADRSTPIAPVLPGGRLYNSYRGQFDSSGAALPPGLISVGDAVCTTTPLAGRGVALAFMQARELVRMLDDHRGDVYTATTEFGDWCESNIKPWFVDHQHVDAERVRRWAGADVDPHRPLPSDLIVAAAEVDSRLAEIVGPYASMDALPESLAAAEPRAREIFADGWRPTPAAGPPLDDLIAAVSTPPAVA